MFDQYESDFLELSASIKSKISHVGSLNGELRQSKLAEISQSVAEAEALVRRMDLEARSTGGEEKMSKLQKVKEYRASLSGIKNDAKQAGNQASQVQDARAGLGLDQATNAVGADSSAGQRERLLTSTERLQNSSSRIHQGQQSLLQTEEIGVSILQDLHRQRQTLHNTRDTLRGTDDNIAQARKVLTSMNRRITNNKIITAGVILALLACILVVLYCKFFSHC